MDDPTEITVTVETPTLEPTQDSTPAVAVVTTPAATDSTLAMEVGALRAQVDALTAENETLRQRTESAQMTADIALRGTIQEAEAEPVAVVEEVTTTPLEPEPQSADADAQKVPATGGKLRSMLHAILF